MKFLRKLVWKWKAFVAAQKAWVGRKYFALFELLTLKAVLLANKLTRKYIVLKGKDPNYVPPPPLPPAPPPDPYEVMMSKRPKNTSIHQVFRPEWVSNLKKHPVLVSRAEWESKRQPVAPPTPAPLQVSLPPQVLEDLSAFVAGAEAFEELVAVAESLSDTPSQEGVPRE